MINIYVFMLSNQKTNFHTSQTGDIRCASLFQPNEKKYEEEIFYKTLHFLKYQTDDFGIKTKDTT